MKIQAIICEFNPMHSGHKKLIEESKKITKAEYTIAIMSGNFLQRGEPALLDKFSRAEMAIKNGIDLVIELPYIYAGQRADDFSKGAIKILDKLNVVDYLIFGTEEKSLRKIDIISEIFLEKDFLNLSKKYQKENFSFPISQKKALKDILKDKNVNIDEDILDKENNILAIQYLMKLKEFSSDIKPVNVQRLGRYKSKELMGQESSATAIRENIFKSGLSSLRNILPKESFNILERFKEKYKTFHSTDKLYKYFMFSLYRDDSFELLENTFDSNEDIANRILNESFKSTNYENLISRLNAKHITSSRLKRIILNYLLEYTKDVKNDIYLNILKSNEKGFKIINKIKESSKINIINKLSYSDLEKHPALKLDIKATDLYYLTLLGKANPGADYKNNIYVKNKGF